MFQLCLIPTRALFASGSLRVPYTTLHVHATLFYSFSKFAVSKNTLGFYQMRIENVTTSDAGVYRCLVRRPVLGGTETIAEFKSDLIVFGENYCTVEIKYAKLKQKCNMKLVSFV